MMKLIRAKGVVVIVAIVKGQKLALRAADVACTANHSDWCIVALNREERYVAQAAIRHDGATWHVTTAQLSADVEKVWFVSLVPQRTEVTVFGQRFVSDVAPIAVTVIAELYRYKGEWKLGFIDRGFREAKEEWFVKYGVPQRKIELRKSGDKISLAKSSEELAINLNWHGKADLDLGCLYELYDGTKGCVQALGDAFGSYHHPPFIELDGDDRTGQVQSGENLRLNAKEAAKIKRVLIYTFIYEGIASWTEVDGVVTIKQQSGPDIVVKLDDEDEPYGMCAIALLQNDGRNGFSVEKINRYFPGHAALDKAFRWGLRWVRGSKD